MELRHEVCAHLHRQDASTHVAYNCCHLQYPLSCGKPCSHCWLPAVRHLPRGSLQAFPEPLQAAHLVQPGMCPSACYNKFQAGCKLRTLCLCSAATATCSRHPSQAPASALLRMTATAHARAMCGRQLPRACFAGPPQLQSGFRVAAACALCRSSKSGKPCQHICTGPTKVLWIPCSAPLC